MRGKYQKDSKIRTEAYDMYKLLRKENTEFECSLLFAKFCREEGISDKNRYNWNNSFKS